MGAQVAHRWKFGLIGGLIALTSPSVAQDVTLNVRGDDTLQEVLETASLALSLTQTDDTQTEDFVAAARADYRRLLTALYSQGFYGGTVTIQIDGREAASLAPLDAPAQIARIDIDVTPGPLFAFGQADIAPLPATVALPPEFTTGAVARSDVIRGAVQTGVDAWRDAGHANAAPLSQRILAHHPERQLDVSVSLSPGPQLQFGPLNVTGNERVRTSRILDIAGLPSGAVFSPQQLDLAASRLRRTGAFQSVALVEGDVSAGNQLNIDAQVIEMKRRRLGVGVEYSTVEGLTFSTFWLHRNLLGGAERLRIEGEITGVGGTTGGVDYELGLTYGRPATLNPDTDLYVEAAIQRIDDPGYELTQLSTEIGLTKTINEWLIYNVGVGYLTADVNDDLGERTYSYLTFPVSAQADRRDDPLNPTGGVFARVELTPFSELGSDAAGVRVYGDGRIYRSVAQDRAVLALRGQLGAVVGAEAVDSPADFLFFSGGGGTVRGHEYQSLDVDYGGVELGGRSFLGLQSEARLKVTDTIGLVGFVDTGFVGADPFDFDNGTWHTGAGLGVRYNTGIGPVRFDLAAPISGPADASESLQFYIGIGQAF